MEPTIIPTKQTTSKEDGSFWNHHYEMQKVSGLSRAQYCRNTQVNYARFCYWVEKISCQDSSFIPVKLSNSPIAVSPTLLCILELHNNRPLKIYDFSALSVILEKMR